MDAWNRMTGVRREGGGGGWLKEVKELDDFKRTL